MSRSSRRLTGGLVPRPGPGRILALGGYTVRVDARAGVYDLVQTPLVVQLATFQPQGPGGAAFGDTILVARGG